MNERLHQIHELALEELSKVSSMEELQNIRNTYLSKKSELMQSMSKMKDLQGEERAKFGQLINSIKMDITQKVEETRLSLEEKKLQEKLAKEVVDFTLPSSDYTKGSKHPFNLIVDEVSRIFIGMGYDIVEGPEVELDHFNFELLNVPKGHPARDMQDSFYIDETHLMRSQTSPVQAHVMLSKNGVGPIKIISPGKVYRRDDDATHSHQFGQIEGLVIDSNVNMGNLLSTLELFARSMFGEKRQVRMRSSYFPFTEPSVEADISCFECGGKGCKLCKGTGWIEVLGAGMVHPNVLEMCGFDTKVYQGFAFGIGIERVAMLKYGIDDIRKFYQNDKRFLSQFTKE
ncbi:MAG: phenylalanine--tRNA ligase subunit alpha [Erysipelotrichaceae bacterium]|nr:phenylalanine--tRNA ligase subunit alpha [Erysipelotrichaceae bacterium]